MKDANDASGPRRRGAYRDGAHELTRCRETGRKVCPRRRVRRVDGAQCQRHRKRGEGSAVRGHAPQTIEPAVDADIPEEDGGGPAGTAPSGRRPKSFFLLVISCVTYAVTSLICCCVSVPLNARIPPPPSSTCFWTAAAPWPRESPSMPGHRCRPCRPPRDSRHSCRRTRSSPPPRLPSSGRRPDCRLPGRRAPSRSQRPGLCRRTGRPTRGYAVLGLPTTQKRLPSGSTRTTKSSSAR